MVALRNTLYFIVIIIFTLVNERTTQSTSFICCDWWLSIFYMLTFVLGVRKVIGILTIFCTAIVFDSLNHIVLGLSAFLLLASILFYKVVERAIYVGPTTRIVLGYLGNIVVLSALLKLCSYGGLLHVGNFFYFLLINLGCFFTINILLLGIKAILKYDR